MYRLSTYAGGTYVSMGLMYWYITKRLLHCIVSPNFVIVSGRRTLRRVFVLAFITNALCLPPPARAFAGQIRLMTASCLRVLWISFLVVPHSECGGRVGVVYGYGMGIPRMYPFLRNYFAHYVVGEKSNEVMKVVKSALYLDGCFRGKQERAWTHEWATMKASIVTRVRLGVKRGCMRMMVSRVKYGAEIYCRRKEDRCKLLLWKQILYGVCAELPGLIGWRKD